MKMIVLSLGVFFGVLLMAGCVSSQAARIQKKSEIYRSLTPRQQRQIKAQKLAVGFTTDMVYMALGKPTRITSLVDRGVSLENWTYDRFIPNPGKMGFEDREVTSDMASGANQGSDRYHPTQMLLPTEECTLIVRFRAGHVVALETG